MLGRSSLERVVKAVGLLSSITSLNQRRLRGLVPDVAEGQTIPRCFYQTHSNSALPEPVLANRAHIRALNPGWRFEFFDGEQRRAFIDAEYGPDILSYYDAIDETYGASRADLFRYLLIYRTGGIYLDVKSSARIPFDDMLRPDDRYVLAVWDRAELDTQGWGEHAELAAAGTPEYQQWHIIAAAGHPLLKAVIERVLHNIAAYVPTLHGTGRYGVLRLTGPIAYTLAITGTDTPAPYRLAGSNTDLGLVYSIYPDARAHRATTGAHYSQLDVPLTTLDTSRRLIDAGARLARAGYRMIRRA